LDWTLKCNQWSQQLAADTEIQLLGPLAVRVAGESRPLPKSRKTRALLALLALEPRPHARTNLCAWIWPDTADPRAALRWSLTKLRDLLADAEGSLITTEGDSINLDWQRVRTDRATLNDLLADADRADLQVLIDFEQRFDRAPLAELDTGATPELELWLESQREAHVRLHQQLLRALIERLTDAPARALQYARQQVTLDPLNQPANLNLLRLTFAVQGRREAQATLERMRKRLADAGLGDAELLAAWHNLATSASERQPAALAVIEPATLEPATAAPTLPQKPSVAVLAFQNLGGHEAGGVMAEGIAVDLNSRLAQLKGLFVIARASANRFSLDEHDARSIGTRLGVRYLVHGTTQRTPDRIRVTVNLIEAELGGAIWSDRFDRPLGDLFEVQDDIANNIVSALEPQIDHAEMERARQLPTGNLDAWECFHRAMWHGFRFTTQDNELAHEYFQRALEQDPGFSRAYAGLSFNHFSKAFLNASDDVPGEIARALTLAEQAVSYDGRDALGHWALGRAQFLNREHDRALGAIDRALLANPNYAQGHYARGFIGCHAGLPDQAIPDLDMAQRLSPFDPLLFAMKSSRAIALTVQSHHEEAVAWALRATQEPNAHFHIYAIAAACLELTGRSDEARRNIQHALSRQPAYSLAVFDQSFPYKQPDHRALIHDALERAGLISGG
jgi:TolB-like protein